MINNSPSRKSNARIRTELPPSHPEFDRNGITHETYIELLLYEIKELRAECASKERKIAELSELDRNSAWKHGIGKAELSDVPQRSARRRNQIRETKSSEKLDVELFPDALPENEAQPATLSNSIPLSQNFKLGLSSAIRRNGPADNTAKQSSTSRDQVGENIEISKPSELSLSSNSTSEGIGNQDTYSTLNKQDINYKPKAKNPSEKSRLSGSSYNPRIKLPQTLVSSEALTTSGANNVEESSTETSHLDSIASKDDAEQPQRDTDNRYFNETVERTSAIPNKLVDSQRAQTMPSSGELTPIKQSPHMQGSSFQVLTSPLTEDDVVLFIKPEEFLTIKIEVASTLSFNPRRSDDLHCTLSINDRETGKGMWKVRKSINQLLSFDNEIRSVMEAFGLPNLPDRSLFASTIPAKVEARKQALQHYFDAIFSIPHIPNLILHRICRFLSLDFINPLDDYRSGAKLEGFLIRRYKGLGTTWKVRWCQVDGPFLEIYEAPGGAMIEQIRLQGAQIGRQSSDNVAEEKGYRHAFLILESKTKMSSLAQKHFFCAESDTERDEWVNVMIEFTENDHRENLNFNVDTADRNQKSFEKSSMLSRDEEFSKDIKEAKKLRKRSFFPFRYKGLAPDLEDDSSDLPLESNENDSTLEAHLASMNLNEGQYKPVFGRDLIEVVNLSSREFNGKVIPSVCFRCLDYLSRTGAIFEEGIFRLSGSASTIRQLRDQFNKELDFSLFEHSLNPDIHTVAGLFKAFLRELPCSIFGDAAYKQLQRMVSYSDCGASKSDLVLNLREFINNPAKVNPINFDFCYVVFQLLQSVISQSSTNLMTIRNVCIVFVPTLRISLDILSLCITDFKCIFEGGDPVDEDKREILDLQIPSF